MAVCRRASQGLLRHHLKTALDCWQAYRANPPVLTRATSSLPGTPHLTPAIQGRLDEIAARHAALVRDSLAPSFSRLPPQEMARLARDIAELEPVVEAAARLARRRAELEEVAAMARDPGEEEDLRAAAAAERDELAAALPALESAVLLSLVPPDAADGRGVVLEVRAGTGGDEACLFAADLFGMYAAHAAARGWRWESGVHRVQRVPATEASGRVHTSAASVAVLPQAAAVEVDLREEDLRVDVFRASGAGGQHVNTTNSAVRVTHLPTGLAVAIQDERSQHKNRAKALQVLRARLYDSRRREAEQAHAADRKAQGRVTDHRVGLTLHGMEAVLVQGDIDPFIDALALDHQMRLLASLGA
ncbi:Peptide chain release factor 1 [Auxenochlorella protothecoides]|uniref:Peptide chain release factor 1 n=1 Tax=Auxenochlorella protothecoides TaxID=3075 RepID=A0A087SBT4_AUXPR|nr:Peptide chain release factor 1 [Auxenochlorella protothecoides]KFM23188.1 Peptide chain release factor 1 [Auxenochlorella protothecoides]